MKTKTVLGGLLCLALSSCSQQEPVLNDSKESQTPIDKNYVSISEAVDIASRHYEAVYGNTRSPRQLNLKGFEVLEKAKTRAEDGSEMYGYYILNFQNNEGFAIVSADRRRHDLYAISDEGSLQLSDTTYNRGLNWYINVCLPGGSTDGNPSPSLPDSLDWRGWPDLGGTEMRYEPLLTGFLSRFSQSTPYNKFCFTPSNTQALVGCLPLAMGTVMGYHQWPQTYAGYTFNWSAMSRNNYNDGWARLFEVIGRPYNANASYGEDATGATTEFVCRTFSNMGYSGAMLGNWSISSVHSSLAAKNPVLIAGYLKDRVGSADNYVGHMFIIDGGYRSKKQYNSFEDGEWRYIYYFHCVWGWRGLSNGYYLLDGKELINSSLDNSNDTPADPCEVLQIVTGYKPSK